MKDQTNQQNGRYGHPASETPAGGQTRQSLNGAADGPDRPEHPFYGNSFTNVGSADIPESPEAIRSRSDGPRSGPQLLDDDYYFG